MTGKGTTSRVHFELCPIRQPQLEKTHSDPTTQDRREITTCQLAGDHPVQESWIARPKWLPALAGNAPQHPGQAFVALRHQGVKARKAARLIPGNDPGEAGLERGNTGAELMAVKGKARLEPEGVTRPEASRRGARSYQRLPEVLGT